MLVLTRKIGESIVINNDIRVVITDIGHGKVRLGIDAPPHITVDRAEIHERRMQFAEVPEHVVVAHG